MMQIIANHRQTLEICLSINFNIKHNSFHINLSRQLHLLGFILAVQIASAQHTPEFALTKDGVEPIVVTLDSLNANQLYKKTINWIHETYKNPSEVIKVDIKNEKVRIEDIKKNVWFYSTPDTTFYYDVEYLFSVNFEDNKIRMSFDFGNTWNRSAQFVPHSYCINYKKLWQQSGEVHPIYKETKPGIDQMMNEIALSLINYLRDDKKNLVAEKQSDWSRLRNRIKSKVIY